MDFLSNKQVHIASTNIFLFDTIFAAHVSNKKSTDVEGELSALFWY